MVRASLQIEHQRFDHFYGQDYARLTREQSRIAKPERTDSFTLNMVSVLFFRLPDTRRAELEALLTDHLVYSIHWKPFAAEQLLDWDKCSKMVSSLRLCYVALELMELYQAAAILM